MNTERSEQAHIVNWLRRRGYMVAAVLNGAGGRSTMPGTLSGMPDLLIFDPPPSKPHLRGTGLEMKRRKKSRTQDNQLDVREKLIARQWEHVIAKGAIEAMERLEALGY